MKQHRKSRRHGADRTRVGGSLLIGALASGAFAAGALGTAGEAEATCVSAGGWFSIGKGCSTEKFGDFAFAIGPGAQATAAGGFNTAIAWGAGAVSEAFGKFNNAIAIGDAAEVDDGGMNALAAKERRGAYASVGVNPERYKLADSSVQETRGSTAIAIGNSARSTAVGLNSFASARGALAEAEARGVRNVASSWGTQAIARAIGGKNNTAIAIGDPDAFVPLGESGGLPEQRFEARKIPTTAIAGNLRSAEATAARAIEVAEPEQSSDNNFAIAIGNGTRAGAGDGSNNYARALGNRSVAAASGGNWNRALVLGHDSVASAGRPIGILGLPGSSDPATYRIAVKQSNGNTASVTGNGSAAVAGPGLRNLASVFGNRSSLVAQGERKRATLIGNDINDPRKDTPKKDEPAQAE